MDEQRLQRIEVLAANLVYEPSAIGADDLKDEVNALTAEVRRLQRHNQVRFAEIEGLRANYDSAIQRLVTISRFLLPNAVKLPDGRVMEFSNPDIEREMLRGLTKAIREVMRPESVSPKPENAAESK